MVEIFLKSPNVIDTIVKKHVQANFLQNSFQGILIDTLEQMFDLFSGHI